MKKEKKKSLDKRPKRTGLKIGIAVSVCVIFLCTLFYDSILQLVFGYETYTWEGTFAPSSTNWGYSTESYAVFTCEKHGYEKRLWATTEGAPDDNGFNRKESGSKTSLQVVGDVLVPYLQETCGWDDLQVGDKIIWNADAEVTVFYRGVTSKTFDTVDEACEEDTTDRSNVKRGMTNATSKFTFPDWEETGSLFFAVVDDTGNPMGLCHNFGSTGYWQSLKYENKSYTVQSKDLTYSVTINLVSEDGDLLDERDGGTVSKGGTVERTVDDTITKDGTTYTYVKSTWTIGDTPGSIVTSTTITVPNCTADVIITCIYKEEVEAEPTPKPDTPATPTPTPEVHECTPGGWQYDSTNHWKECTECKEVISETKDSHAFESTEPDDEGNYTKTCTECGYSASVHKHNLIEWRPEYLAVSEWQEYQDALAGGKTYKDFGYYKDPDKYHWKYCDYDSCDHETGAKAHIWSATYKDEGSGYMVMRCTECRWIKDYYPVVIDLTLDPKGGIFPLTGSSDPVTIENIEYGSETTLGLLGSEYFPEKEGMSLSGFAYFFSGEGYMYTADYETRKLKGAAKFFTDLGDGTYTTKIPQNCTIYAQWKAPSYEVVYHANNANAQGDTWTSYHDVGKKQNLSKNGYYCATDITYNTGSVSASVETTMANTKVYAEFLGWALTPDGTVVYEDGEEVLDIINTAGTVNLYAVWDYKSVILPNATATDGGSKLSAWKNEKGNHSVLDSTGNYSPKEYKLTGKNEIFHAVWVDNEYTVTFDSNGGSACSPKKVVYKQTFGTLPTTTRKGYTFLGWKWKVSDEIITADSVVEYAMNYELTAQWKVNDITVTFDYNFDYGTAVNTAKNNTDTSHGITVVSDMKDKMTIPYDVYYGALPRPTRDGYTFAGWYTEEKNNNGCGDQACLIAETSSRVTSTANHTLYARWIPETIKIYLDYNHDYSIWED